jgi:4-hydroxy-tetrahydrodipicolinate synthase
MRFQGAYTALITPFVNDELHLTGLKTLLDHQIKGNIDGVVLLGTTGEASTLTDHERNLLLETAISHVDKRLPIIVGTGTNATQSTIEKTIRAKEMGADAALIPVPYYNRPMQEGIIAHFLSVADAVDLPICIYNHPKRSGTHIEASTVATLSQHPNIVSLKDCSGDFEYVQQVIETIVNRNSNFSVVSGNDELTYPLMALGASGVISVASNAFPDLMIALTHAMLEGDLAKAKELHYSLRPFFNALCLESNPIPIKGAMELLGMPSGGCRLPLTNLSVKNLLLMKDLLVKQSVGRWF